MVHIYLFKKKVFFTSDWFDLYYKFNIQGLNDLIECGNKKFSSSESLFYETPTIEDVRPHDGIKKFRSEVYSTAFVLIIISFLL